LKWGLTNYLSGLASNLDLPNLSLPSSYGDEPLSPSMSYFFNYGVECVAWDKIVQ
jgi:hypothetical protein